MKTPLYLDYASTTPIDPVVASEMMQFMTPDGQFGNPASRSHRFGWQAEEAVDIARNQIATAVGADPREIVWTSGATESDNLALKGVMRSAPENKRHLITVATEHKAVLDTCEALSQEGVEVTYLKPQPNGRLDLSELKEAFTESTLLVSVMAVNNETGVIQDIAAISALCREHGALLHVDAAQAIGKIPFNVVELGVDLASFSAHKAYGPKGIGALYVRRSPYVQVAAMIHGGGHERGMRSGTLPTHQIVGMGKAFELAAEQLQQETTRYQEFRNRLWQGLSEIEGIQRNGDPDNSAANILNISVAGVDGETLLMSLFNLAVSSGSACNSASVEPSYVLKAMGVDDELAHSAIRISVGRFTTSEDIDYAIAELRSVIEQLRQL
ncbi:IscS subfamily cysteine desulfurase [Pleionea litopenaei]|uniref:cysteine desulfurase n=1 Tax=Pleionea litopenaei TaxID=3070815 RepID=A0AA51X768_9GAMM|nr:IscS subfamily cysteine desulfurase [Pleionea sp. HL-JVS1]WMS87609.1 IscS subfamily cysteine desulfurase [Pleionea sp. HL-JVS1]